MLLRPYSLKKINKSTSTLSPKGLKKPTYLRFKPNRENSQKGGRSLCSIQTNRQCSSLTNRRMLSHRKLISVSAVESRQNLTDRRMLQDTERERKCTVQSEKNIGVAQSEKQQRDFSSKKRFHINKFGRNDRMRTLQNEQTDNIERVLQIKENILKQFIDRFQEELKEISQKKSSRETLSTHRMKNLNTNKLKTGSTLRLKTQNTKEETTKKARNIMSTLNSNQSTLNLSKCGNEKQNLPLQSEQMERNKFREYIKQIKDHKKKDQKIFIMKNHKKSLQNITISKIGESQTITSRISKIQTKSKLNLKDLFRHSKKYQPYLKDTATLVVHPKRIEEIQEKQSNLEKSSLIASPIIHKQSQQPKQTAVEIDCSAIEQMNQSSFMSDVGRKSLLKHLQNESVKMVKEEQRKTRRCLAKMKSIFPSDFF